MAQTSAPPNGTAGLSRLGIVGLVAAEFFVTLDGSAITVALPTIRDAFDSDMGVLQWTQVAYMLAAAAFAIPFGAVGDRIGRDRVLLAGLVLFVGGATVTALAPSMPVLIVGRAVTGAGSAAITVLSLAILTSSFASARIPIVVGAWTAASSAASVIAPAISGLLVQTVGWRWMFAVSILPVLAVAAVVRRLPNPSSDEPTGHVDWLGAGLLTVATALIAGGLNASSSIGGLSKLAGALIAVGMAMVALLVLQQHSSRYALADWRTWSTRPLSVILAARWIIIFVVTGVMFQQTMLLQNGLGFSPFAAGLMDVPPALMAVLFAYLSARILRRLGLGLTLAAGFWCVALGLYGFSRADYEPSVGPLVVAFMAEGIGFGLSSATLSTAVMGRVPTRAMGGASGVQALLTQLAALLGIAGVGAAVATWVYRAWVDAGGSTCTGHDLLDNITAGAIDEIARECGDATAATALSAYTDGITDALGAGGVVMAVAGVGAWWLLSGLPRVRQDGG